MHYVQKITRAIRKGKFDKVVAARVVKSAKPENFNPALFFKKLCRKYPNAFVSLVYTPQFGLWIGASPEILLQVDGKGFKTYSLAGTQAATGNKQIVWGEKEKEEQKIVSDYITSSFKNITTDTPLITGPETVAAGNLLHLRTTFVYNTVPHSMWQKAVHELHPTPAVGGLPKKDAIDFILKHERAQRGYYSGYCGPVNLDRQINLFVNLRCMQVLKNKLAVYAGCGITADSVPADEWNESELKTRTLLGLL
jgi:isochorismate synthase